MAAFDPAGIVRVLNQHGVRFVVIGGIAAQTHDLGLPATIDIDITPARDRRNLARLAAAFDELEAGLNTADVGGTWFPRLPVANWAQYDTLLLITRCGLLAIVFAPDGAEHGYADLVGGAVRLALGDEPALVITVEVWRALKAAADPTIAAKDEQRGFLARD